MAANDSKTPPARQGDGERPRGRRWLNLDAIPRMTLAFETSPLGPAETTIVPAVFDKLGIRFMYPDNWTLDEQEAIAGNQSVTVYSPGGAFWSIVVHDRTADPSDLAAEALTALKAEYEGSEAEPAREEVAGETLRGYDVNFFYLDLTNTALIRSFRTADATCLVLCQAEDRELVTAEPVFRAITTSLLSKAKA